MNEPVVAVEQVPMAYTAWLRSRVLRPGWTPLQIIEGDRTDSVQIAALHEREAVACANVHPEPAPWDPDGSGWWRLRGVATDPAWRRQGLAARVVRAVCAAAALEGGTQVWCNARIGAFPFYEALGWSYEGGLFDIPEIGEHRRMWIGL